MKQNGRKDSPYQFAYFVLNDVRSRLYERIDRRVDLMVEQGLVDEVTALKTRGCTKGNDFNAGTWI